MVGVPGRSKACLTCRRRKKGCDLQRPACGQCRRGALICEGYAVPSIFVNSTQHKAQATRSEFRTEIYSPNHANIVENINNRQQVSYQTQSRPSVDVVSQILARSADQDHLLGTYWELYLPDGRLVSNEALKYSTAGWTGVAQELCQQSTAVRAALLSNCLGLLGQRNDRQWMQLEGQKMYGRALKAVASRLVHGREIGTEELLVATRLLSLFELCFGVNEDNRASISQRWFIHVTGDIAITASKGPSSYTRGFAHRLFADGRLHQVVADLERRQPSVLNEPEWKTRPWSEHEKSPKDFLLDILVALPGLFADQDAMICCEDADERMMRLEKLIHTCWSHHEDLRIWVNGTGQPTMDFVTRKLSEFPYSDSMPTGTELAMGHLGLLYWTTCILLYDVLRSSLNPSETRQDIVPRPYCRKIAQFLPFFLTPNAGCFATTMLTFPVGVALSQLFKDGVFEKSEERVMLEHSFSSKYGQSMSRFLQSSAHRKRKSENWAGGEEG